MEKEMILEQLRDKGFRITKQRELLIDIILKEECTCCKEIYFLASKKDPNIGMATIYRMVNTMEEIGALDRKSAYQVCHRDCKIQGPCTVELEDDTRFDLNRASWNRVIQKGLEACGYLKGQSVKNVVMKNS